MNPPGMRGSLYDVFLSYSHAADGRLAPALQSGLQRFAKPWNRLRALRVFRDKTGLAPTPGLWSAIKAALDNSEHFVLLASPAAAGSPWVEQEVQHWLANRPAKRILVVLTEGEISWDADANDFDWQRTTALPPALRGCFQEEPLWVDMRWARTQQQLPLENPAFREAVAELSSALRGIPKDQLIGEDIRQHRKATLFRRGAIAGLAALSAALATAAFFAVEQRNLAKSNEALARKNERTANVNAGRARESQSLALRNEARALEKEAEALRNAETARAQARIALARQLAAQSGSVRIQFPDQLPVAVLLALESTQMHSSFEGNDALRAALALLPRAVRRYAYHGLSVMTARVRALAFSKDGKYLAVARDDGTADLLDLPGGKRIAVLPHEENPGAVIQTDGGGFRWKAPGRGAEVTTLEFSADGRILATGSDDGTARVWETAGGRELLRAAHESGVSSVALDQSGRHLATGSKDGTARILEAGTGRELTKVEHKEEVREVTFSPDGRLLGAISTNGSVSLLDTGKRVVHKKFLSGNSGLGLAFSPDSTKLATASGDYAVVWDVNTGESLFRASHTDDPSKARGLVWVDDVKFSSDGRYLATAGRDSTARVWNLETGREVVRLEHGANVNAVAFSPEDSILGTASWDGTARLWELPSGRELLRSVHPGGAEVIAFRSDGGIVASGGVNGAIRVWDLSRGDETARLHLTDEVRAVGISPDGSTLATGVAGGFVRLWRPNGEPKSPAKKLPVPRIDRLVYSQDGSHLAARWSSTAVFLLDAGKDLAFTQLTSSRDAGDAVVSPHYVAAWDRQRRSIRVRRTSGGQEAAAIHAPDLYSMAFDATGAVLATQHKDVDGNGPLRVWALPRATEQGRVMIKGRPGEFAVSPGGRLLAVAVSVVGGQRYAAKQFVEVWDVAASRRVARIPQAEAPDWLGFDRGGTRLFTAQGSEVRVWDLPDGASLSRLRHEKDIEAVRIGSKENVIVTISGGIVHVWDTASGGLLSRITEAGYVRDVRLSADDRRLLTGSADGTAILWLWKTEDLQAEACKRLDRNLTPAQWNQYLGGMAYRKSCPDLP